MSKLFNRQLRYKSFSMVNTKLHVFTDCRSQTTINQSFFTNKRSNRPALYQVSNYSPRIERYKQIQFVPNLYIIRPHYTFRDANKLYTTSDCIYGLCICILCHICHIYVYYVIYLVTHFGVILGAEAE